MGHLAGDLFEIISKTKHPEDAPLKKKMSMFDGVLNNFLFASFVTLSIGLSDAVELFLNPYVHQIHNLPDCYSRTMKFEDYRWWHAAYTDVQASWFLLLPLTVFPVRLFVVDALKIGFVNVLIPLAMYVTGIDKEMPYMGHMLLYLLNFVAVVVCVFK